MSIAPVSSQRKEDAFGLPVAVLGRFDTVLAFDHARQRVLAVPESQSCTRN